MARRAAFGAVRLEEERAGGFHRAIKWIVLLGLVAGGVMVAPQVPSWWRQVQGRDPIFMPEHDANLGAVDLQAVHHELLPKWTVVMENRLEIVDGETAVEQTYAELTEAVAADENLVDLLGEMNELIEIEGIPAEPGQQKLLWLTRAWNQYLDDNGARYFLRGFIVKQPEPVLQLYTHAVVGDGTVSVDGDEVRVRFISRLDKVNRYAPYHGSEAREGAAVLSDRVVPYATEQIWPLLGSTEPKSRRAKLFREAIVAEVEAALPDAFATLKATADVRAAAVQARADMWDRHHSCMRYVLKNQPWNGFDEETLEELEVQQGGGACPVAYAREVAALRSLSRATANADGLEDAVGRLVAWVGRLGAIHEARHYMDRIDLYDDDADVVCKICSGSDGPIVRGEVSAVLAEFAWTDAPAVALYRQCVGDEAEVNRATEVIFEELKWSCSEGPHPNLQTAAREQAKIGFDREAPIEVVDLPASLPLVRSADLLRQ